VKRHAAEVAKATRAHEIAAREVERLSAELAHAQQKLAQAERTLSDLEAAAPA
jgi:chromosome segregation ATPase